MRGNQGLTTALALGLCLAFAAAEAEAIPAWARKYQTSCTTCHVAFPKLNAFGKAFRANGYRMPAGDKELTKVEDVKLGSEGWKRLWPQGVWPGAIPGGWPFAVMIPSQVNVVDGADVQSDFAFPREVDLLGGGTLGESIGYYAGVTLVEGNEFGGLHRLFGQFDSLAGKTMLNVRFGYMESRAVPFSSHRKLTLSNYLLNAVGFDNNTMNGTEPLVDHAEGHSDEQARAEEPGHGEALRVLEIGAGHGHGHGNGDLFSFASSQRGIELWGATGGRNGGGFEYGLGFVNGNGAGSDEGTFDNNSFKDVYWRASYKFGGMSVTGKLGEGAAAPSQTDAWVDNSFRVGTFGYYGRSPYRLTRMAPLVDEHGVEPLGAEEHHEAEEGHGLEPQIPELELIEETMEGDENFTRIGGDFDLWVGDLNLFGALLYGKNDRRAFDGRENVDFTSWFVQGDYVILPWVIGALRYEKVELPTGFVDVERLLPHVTLLVRANVKLVVEGQLYRNESGRDRGLFNITFAF